MNVLCDHFPEYVNVHGCRYKIETDFREWIRFSNLVCDEYVPWQMKVELMLQWYRRDIPEDIEAAIYALGDFLSARELYSNLHEEDKQDAMDVNDKPAFSFEEDAGCIYSAFRESYGIDLETVKYMHWWKFSTLFDGLPEDTEIKQRIYYRTLDPKSIKDKEERKRVKRIQERIRLRGKKKGYVNDYSIGDVFA